MRAVALAALSSLPLLLAPASLWARPRPAPPPPPPPLSAAAEKATELTERAYELQRRGALNDAIRLYQEALAVDPLPKRHRNLAIPLEQAERPVEALREYFRFQRDERGEPPENRRDVAERVERLLQRLGRLRVAPLGVPTAQVSAEARRAAAPAVAVRVPLALGERPRCLAAAEQPGRDGDAGEYLCTPGPVEVELLLRGERAASRRVQVVRGGTAEARFSLTGPVLLRANRPSPALTLDGAPLTLPSPGRLPVTLMLALGAHELIGRDGRETLRRPFTVRDGEKGEVELRFAPRRTWLWLVVGGVALGAAAAAAGAAGYAATRPPPPGGADVLLPPPI